jgi:hypothetical protein
MPVADMENKGKAVAAMPPLSSFLMRSVDSGGNEKTRIGNPWFYCSEGVPG